MPRYAVDFLAEIQEVTSATNFDDCSDSVDILNNCHYFNAASEQSSLEKNVVSALMGNGQCCFKRYPGYQAHRHVVVSRGVQCSEAIIKKNIDAEQNIADNYMFSPHATERGDNASDNCKVITKFSDMPSFVHQKASLNSSQNFEFMRSKPEISTLVSEEPPELKESSKFVRKKYSMDLKKSRKYLDDEIDSLSATISNYSLHEKLLRFESNALNKNGVYEQIDKNNHQFNVMSMTPTPRQRQTSFKGSTDAIRGSTTKTLTCDSKESKITNKYDYIENPSSESYTSFGHCNDNKGFSVSKCGDCIDDTHGDADKIISFPQTIVNKEILDRSNVPIQLLSDETFQLYTPQTSQHQNMKTRVFNNNQKRGCAITVEERPVKSNSDSKCSSSVTFMKGSEELFNNEKAKSVEFNKLNALRRKQKFLMRHTRNNSKLVANTTTYDDPLTVIVSEFSSNAPAEYIHNSTLDAKQSSIPDYLQQTPEALTPKPCTLNTQFTTPSSEPSRNNCASRNSSHSERISSTPMTNIIKMKRTVSFDKNKTNDSFNKLTNDRKSVKPEGDNQICTRSTVRAKYCSNKIVKQRFYISESANIESVLRDPSDRRIKAICDRHNCDIEIYSKIPKSGFLKNIIVLAAPNSENLRKCVRSLDYSMCWCLTAQLP